MTDQNESAVRLFKKMVDNGAVPAKAAAWVGLKDGQVEWEYSVGAYHAENDLLSRMMGEINVARSKFPWWPADVVHGAAVVLEEAGEVLKAANELRWGQKDATVEDLRKEIVQTMAMCVRLWTECPLLKESKE